MLALFIMKDAHPLFRISPRFLAFRVEGTTKLSILMERSRMEEAFPSRICMFIINAIYCHFIY